MKILFAESHNLDRPDPLGSHQYIRLFQEAGHECLWFGPAISPMHIFKPDELNRYRYRVWKEGGREIDGIHWIVPFTLLFYYNKPLLRSHYIGRNQYRWSLPSIRNMLRQADFDEVDLLWCAGPVALSLLDLVPHKLSCYRIADRLDQFQMIPANVGVLQKELIREVDFVLATSLALKEWAGETRKDNLHYLPNGVSEIFFEAADEKPDDFPVTDRPVAIYTGTLDTRFDMDTLAFAVRNLRDIHFLILGPVTSEDLKTELIALLEEDNFSWPGQKPYSSLPAYLQAASVGIIPFLLNDLTEAVNPIKYYEYLASGLPVVAPPMRELKTMKGPIQFYNNKEEFCATLREAVKNGVYGKNERIEFARKLTWKSRFEEILKIVERKQADK